MFTRRSGRRLNRCLSTVFLLAMFPLITSDVAAATTPDRIEAYRGLGGVALRAHIFEPGAGDRPSGRPAIVLFNGGGWINGDVRQFFPQARAYANRGIVAFCMEYRVQKPHRATPFDAFTDAAHAVAWVRHHAARLGIDPNRIAAGGGSAGGQLAAATATVPDDRLPDDLPASCRPNLLVLFNPVLDNGPDGYGHERIGDAFTWFSPAHNVRENLPPTLVMLGTEDDLIPVATVETFARNMAEHGNLCVARFYEEQGHGFFNQGRGKHGRYDETLRDSLMFLEAQGWIAPRTGG